MSKDRSIVALEAIQQPVNPYIAILKPYKVSVAASAASVCSVLLGSPFDALKVRMQTEYYTSTWTCAQTTLRNDGIRGFFRGIIPPLLTVNIVKTLSVSVYESIRSHLQPVGGPQTGHNSLTAFYRYFVAGSVAGASTSLISSPLEMIRNQRILWDTQVSHSTLNNGLMPNKTSSIAYFRKFLSLGLTKGLYRGYSIHFTRETLGTGVYWSVYECLHWLPILSTDGTRKGGSIWGHFFAGGMTGMCAWLFVFPLDLVKNVYQTQVFSKQKTTIWNCIRKTYKSGGVLGFYYGVWPTMMRAFPIHGANLLIYEYFLRLLS